MNLTDLANARSGFSQEMNNLLTLIAGSHTAEQRSAQITTTTAECFTLCKTAKAVRVANPHSIATKDFYAREGLPLCELMDSYHLNLGGTRMYEMFCIQPLPRHTSCGLTIYQPSYGPGPLVMSFFSGTNQCVHLYQFQGTIEYTDGTTVNYATPTDIEFMDIPDDGHGYGTIRLRGVLGTRDAWTARDYNRSTNSGPRDQCIDVWQWGTECVVLNYDQFLAGIQHQCLAISATDAPRFGVFGDDTYGTTLHGFFSKTQTFDSDISHWDVSNVTMMRSLFNDTSNFNQDISGWDVSNVTDMAYMFYSADAFNQDLSGWNVSNVTQYTSFTNGDSGLLEQNKPNFI